MKVRIRRRGGLGEILNFKESHIPSLVLELKEENPDRIAEEEKQKSKEVDQLDKRSTKPN